MAVLWPEPKDPDEVLDYEVDWSGRLDDGDTLATSSWEMPTVPDEELVKNSSSINEDETKTLIWLSGGTLGENYELLNRVTTAGGRTMDQTMKLKVRAK
jgi:hypothetical protein